jgi:hypothetical protein
MSYGFLLNSGTGSNVIIDSSNNAVGVFLDYFTVAYNTTESRSYPSFIGTQFFTVINQTNAEKITVANTTINNSTKTVTVTVPSSTNPSFQSSVNVIVVGK